MENINHNTETKEYRIERLNGSKLQDLETLYTAVYGYNPVKDYFKKKYNTAYTGAEYIGYIAYNQENIPVAYYGVTPCFIEYNNQIVLSAQSGDTMTHPHYRYKGMFVELSKITFDLCKAAGMRFIFGFPNQNSYHGAVHKLGWKMTETMESFTIPVNALPLESLSRRLRLPKWIYEQYVKWILHNYLLPQKGILNSGITRECGGTYRDEKYFQYKTYSRTYVIKIGSAKIWIKIGNGLIIGDLEIEDQDFDAVMDAIKKLTKRMGLLQVFFQTSPDTRLHTLFAGRYKSKPSFPILFQDFGAEIPLDKIKFTFADTDIF